MSTLTPPADVAATPSTGRLQLALNVTDIDAAVDFYSRLFATQPAKRREGYANFAIANPPLKLVLFEGAEGGTINHLGVEVPDAKDVTNAVARLEAEGLPQMTEEGVACCYALQDKTWVSDPDGARWEVYTVLADSPTMGGTDDGCACGDAATTESSEATGSGDCC